MKENNAVPINESLFPNGSDFGIKEIRDDMHLHQAIIDIIEKHGFDFIYDQLSPALKKGAEKHNKNYIWKKIDNIIDEEKIKKAKQLLNLKEDSSDGVIESNDKIPLEIIPLSKDADAQLFCRWADDAWYEGDSYGALKHYEKALNIDPENEKIITRINHLRFILKIKK